MEAITKADFDLNYSTDPIDDKEFAILAQLALDLTDLLCFGRTDRNEASARRAMEEMIRYWIEHGGVSAVGGQQNPKSERVGNYSITHRDEPQITLRGVTVSPAALVILDRAGLRNCNL